SADSFPAGLNREAVAAVDYLVELSAQSGDEAVFNALLAIGELLGCSGRAESDVRREVALCLAAGRGDSATVEELLRSGIEVNCAPSFGGMTPLMLAARFGHVGLAELLLQQPGIALNATTIGGQTAVSLCRDQETGAFLAHAIACRSEDGGRYALLQAACLGHGSVLRALLEAQVDPNHRDDKGRSALFIAAARRHLEACETLLAHGADPAAGCGTADVWTVADDKLRTVLQLYCPGS
ncbi:unnamed protein product, partial [Polarella glacialis]